MHYLQAMIVLASAAAIKKGIVGGWCGGRALGILFSDSRMGCSKGSGTSVSDD